MGGFHGLQYNALTPLAIRGTSVFACSQFCSSSLILLTTVIIQGICGDHTAQSSSKICHVIFFSGQNPKLPEFWFTLSACCGTPTAGLTAARALPALGLQKIFMLQCSY